MSIPNRTLADVSAVTAKARSSGIISKEDDRRLKLQQWKESKAATDKRAEPSETKAAPDRNAQFFARRERRIQQEQEKKRASRSGKENTPMIKPTADAHLSSKGAKGDATAHTPAGTRVSNTPTGSLAPEAQAGLTGATSASAGTAITIAVKRTQSRAKQQQPFASATTIRAARNPPTETPDPSMDASAPIPATGPDARTVIRAQTDFTTPSRRSALSRPKASPYKERNQLNAPPAAANLRGADEQPGPSPALSGDRLSGQLARLGAGGAGARREWRVAGGGVVKAAAGARAAARRETFQDSRALPATGSGVAGLVPGARSMPRRASSAGPASEERASGGSGSRLLERRRLVSHKAAHLEDRREEPSTPPPTTATPSANQQLRVSTLSLNASAVDVNPHPKHSSPKCGAALAEESERAAAAAAEGATSAEPAPVSRTLSKTTEVPRVVRPAALPEPDDEGKAKTASSTSVSGEESTALDTLGLGKQSANLGPSPLAPGAAAAKAGPRQSPAPTAAPPASPTVQVVMSEGLDPERVGVMSGVLDEAGRVTERRDRALPVNGQAAATVTAAGTRAGTGVASEQDTGGMRGVEARLPPPALLVGSTKLLAVSCKGGGADAGGSAEVPPHQSTPKAEATEGPPQADADLTAQGPTAAAVPPPAGTVMAGAATGAAASPAAAAAAAAAASVMARDEDTGMYSTPPRSTGQAMALDPKIEVEHAPSLLSRGFSLFSRRQDPLASTGTEGGGASAEVPAAPLDTLSESSPDGGPSSTCGSQGPQEPPPTAATTGVTEAGDVGYSSPASSPSGGKCELGGEVPPGRCSRGTSANGLVVPTGEAVRDGEVIDRTDAPLSRLKPRRIRSGSSPAPTAARTTSTPPQGKKAVASTGHQDQKSTPKAGNPRSALTPPGYRSRSQLPSAGRASPPGCQASVATKSAGETKATSSVAGPRPAGLTPPGYRSRSCLQLSGRKGSPQGEERTVSPIQGNTVPPVSDGPVSTWLTPPGSRSGGSSLLAERMSLARRDSAMVATTSVSRGGGRSPLRESEMMRPTPDRRPDRGARQTAGLGTTPPRCIVPPPSGVPDPAQQHRQQEQQGVVGEAETVRKKDVGCSPRAPGDGGLTGDCPTPPVPTTRVVETLPTEPPLPPPPPPPPPVVGSAAEAPFPAHRWQGSVGVAEGETARDENNADSPVTRGGSGSPVGAVSGGCDSLAAVDASETGRSRSPGAGGSPAAPPTARQAQGCSGDDTCAAAAAADAATGEGSRERKALEEGTSCSPTAPPALSSRERKAARPPSTPRAASPAAGGRGGVGGVGRISRDADAAAACGSSRRSSSSGPAAVRTPPEEEATSKGTGRRAGGESERLSEVLHRSPNFAAGFVSGRRKRRAVSGVPVVKAASAVGDDNDGGRKLSRRSQPVATSRTESERNGEREERLRGGGVGEGSGEESSGEESGSSWETCSSSDEEDEGCEAAEQEGGRGWGGLSYLHEINDHPYGDEIVIDPDLVRSSSSGNGSGSARSSLPRSSFGESNAGEGRASCVAAAATADTPHPVKMEMATQTTPGGEGVSHKLVQAGDGRLLTEVEVQDECNMRELRERLEMMNHDLLAEVFHREVVKQEEAQKRRRLEEARKAELLLMQQEIKTLGLEHDNEKIKMRWEHADELARVEAEAGDGVELKHELEEERRLRAEDERRHEDAQQKERRQRKEWEGRCDDLVREKREQAKLHREEMASSARKAEAEKRKAEARHREAHKKVEGVVKMQLETIHEMDRENDELREENDELREENARLRERLGIVEDEERDVVEEKRGGREGEGEEES